MRPAVQATRPIKIGAGGWRECDLVLTLLTLFLLLTGLVMVASASVSLAERLHHEPLHYFWRQCVALTIGVCCGWFILNRPLSLWQQVSGPLLLGAILLLILVLIPGVGREVNGSVRWLGLGPVNLQCSELTKIAVITYLSAYLVRRADQLHLGIAGFMHPLAVIILLSGLLLLEPDYGAVVVIFLTAMGMLFMAGAPLRRFMVWLPSLCVVLGALAVFSSYRLKRLKGFIDPWQDPFNSGYQLIQSLIAFGRGEWSGVGLGSSVQKLFYLTQAHTDFIFAISAEELGLVFSVSLIAAFFALVWRAFDIARLAQQSARNFAAFMAYGIGLILGIQAFIHMGVNVGLLPTKGLTLPLYSYGANSIIVSCMLIALLLRVDLENRQHADMDSLVGPGDGRPGAESARPWQSSSARRHQPGSPRFRDRSPDGRAEAYPAQRRKYPHDDYPVGGGNE